MAKQLMSNVKLGTFVLAGLLFLVLLLFMIGKNENLFGSTYVLKARFDNIQGLVAGNNVRFAGIEAGTVKKVNILSDTVIEISMIIDTKMQQIIRKNAVASIGTDGLVGNKVVNIIPGAYLESLAVEGDIIATKKKINTDDILETLQKTTSDVMVIADGLKTTVKRINKSNGLWSLLEDESIPKQLRVAINNIQSTTGKAGIMVNNLNTIVLDLKNGKGSVGELLRDTSFATNLNQAVNKIKNVGDEADSLAATISNLVVSVKEDVNNGKGPVHALLKDSSLVIKISSSLDNVQKGTDGFNQNMEALKHNFLFRGYFKKLEKQQAKEMKLRANQAKN
jgi:phospholipid/cholesterol/gamma-HCH transport system substrate-binding protein